MSRNDPTTAAHLTSGKLKFRAVNLTSMPDVCRESTFDVVIDYGGLHGLLLTEDGGSGQGVLKCIDHLQDAVRLGNILVCLSSLEKVSYSLYLFSFFLFD